MHLFLWVSSFLTGYELRATFFDYANLYIYSFKSIWKSINEIIWLINQRNVKNIHIPFPYSKAEEVYITWVSELVFTSH